MVSMPARRTENKARVRRGTSGELEQVQGAGLAGQTAVPGQEPGELEPLGLGKCLLDKDERG